MDTAEFRELVLGYYREHGRALPWRYVADPYAVLVSEVMLQQTPVSRVLRSYEAFLERFPDMRSLAEAPLADVLAAWSGLGYNRRARSLKLCAETVLQAHGGSVPQTLEALMALPGIGYATAAQVLAFAYGVPVPFIETNIRAVYIHHFFAEAEAVPDSALLPLVAETLDREDPRTWYYALMDYGTHLKAKGPNPGRRSATHKRQARFEGSMRQVRGAVLRKLVAGDAQTAEELARTTGFEKVRIAAALEALAAEGLLVQQGRLWRIA